MISRALIIKNNKILLIHRFNQGREYYVLPGGHIEEGESKEDAVIREVKEETNLNANVDKLLWTLINPIDNSKWFIFLITSFNGKLAFKGPELDSVSKDNKYFLEWHNLSDIYQLNLVPGDLKNKIMLLTKNEKKISPIKVLKTQVFNSNQLSQAAKLIKAGELVAFPTETVYGLGANALSSSAVKKIFIAKGRPSDNPLIIHISSKDQLYDYAIVSAKQKPLVEKIISTFWPGPLTLVLKDKGVVPKEVTAGLSTIAIRMPNSKIALKLISLSGVPLAAPSANISSRPSSTSFEHVFDDFNHKIAGIIKYKSCEVGLESTVLDLTSKVPTILRPGGVSFEDLKKVLPSVIIHYHSNLAINHSKKVRSPGMKYKHYSPNAVVVLFELSALSKINSFKASLEKEGYKVLVVDSSNISTLSKNIFKIFRDADKVGYDYVLVSAVAEEGIGLAVMNRLRKAAVEIIK